MNKNSFVEKNIVQALAVLSKSYMHQAVRLDHSLSTKSIYRERYFGKHQCCITPNADRIIWTILC